MSHLFWCQWSHCILMKTPPHPRPCPRCWCWWEHHTSCCHLENAVPISRRQKVMLGLASRPRCCFWGLALPAGTSQASGPSSVSSSEDDECQGSWLGAGRHGEAQGLFAGFNRFQKSRCRDQAGEEWLAARAAA